MSTCTWLPKNKEVSVLAISVGGSCDSYDNSVLLLLWRLYETLRLLEHGPQNPGFY